MAEIIKDGTGSGNTARVDVDNRLSVKALVLPEDLEAGLLGNAFDISAGLITITNDTCNSLLYIKNNECCNLVIDAIFFDSGCSTCGTGAGQITWHLGPTAGTLVCDACDAQVLNRQIGASCTLTADAYKASAVSKTLTGGSTVQFPSSGGLFVKPFIIPKGQAFGISYTAPSGNMSQVVQAGIVILKGVTNGD
jgi:hypothetical protein